MKNISHLICLFALIAIISSCSKNEKEEIDGKWDDIIKLSTREVKFDANANSVTIKTKGDWWWIHCVSVNDKFFVPPESINLLSDNYIFQQDCFMIEKKDKNTIYIEIDENQSNAERVIVVGFQAGDYGDFVRITQASR